ncbi:MAG: hypothetical protein HY332_12320 [Chloroflexi bacterium]|nr:hypothetical protein [Chloroflexota bacterium]
MRIIIETDDRERAAVQLPGMGLTERPGPPTESARGEALDGGAPSEELVRFMAAIISAPGPEAIREEGISAGEPPAWLEEAIQQASAAAARETGGATDAGAAPAIG